MVLKSVKRRIFSTEFKENTVELYLSSGKSISVLSQELGLSISTLHRWVTMSKKVEPKINPNIRDKSGVQSIKKENAELKKKLASIEEEALILKKCIAFFAKK